MVSHIIIIVTPVARTILGRVLVLRVYQKLLWSSVFWLHKSGIAESLCLKYMQHEKII